MGELDSKLQGAHLSLEEQKELLAEKSRLQASLTAAINMHIPDRFSVTDPRTEIPV